jgi:hypothetical protein
VCAGNTLLNPPKPVQKRIETYRRVRFGQDRSVSYCQALASTPLIAGSLKLPTKRPG